MAPPNYNGMKKQARNLAKPKRAANRQSAQIGNAPELLAAPHLRAPGRNVPATSSSIAYTPQQLYAASSSTPFATATSPAQAQATSIHFQAGSRRATDHAAVLQGHVNQAFETATNHWIGERGLFRSQNNPATTLPHVGQIPGRLDSQSAQVAVNHLQRPSSNAQTDYLQNTPDKPFQQELVDKKCQFWPQNQAEYFRSFTNAEIIAMRQLPSSPPAPDQLAFNNPNTMSRAEVKSILNPMQQICNQANDDVEWVRQHQDELAKLLMRILAGEFGFQEDYVALPNAKGKDCRSADFDPQASWTKYQIKQQSDLAKKIKEKSKDGHQRYVEAVCRDLVSSVIEAHEAGEIKIGNKKVAGRAEVMSCSTRIYYIIRVLFNLARMRHLLFDGETEELIRAPLKSMLGRFSNLWSNSDRPKGKRRHSEVDGDNQVENGVVVEEQPRSRMRIDDSSHPVNDAVYSAPLASNHGQAIIPLDPQFLRARQSAVQQVAGASSSQLPEERFTNLAAPPESGPYFASVAASQMHGQYFDHVAAPQMPGQYVDNMTTPQLSGRYVNNDAAAQLPGQQIEDVATSQAPGQYVNDQVAPQEPEQCVEDVIEELFPELAARIQHHVGRYNNEN